MKRTGVQHHALHHHRETKWHVFLHDDPRANEIVAGYIGGEGYEDRLRRDVLCDDGRTRNLWSTSYAEATAIKKAGCTFGFSMTVFVQQGSGMPRKWIDPNIARRREAMRRKVRLLED